METYSGDMRCHFDDRFGDQMYDNIRSWPSRVAQGEFVLGVIKALDVESAIFINGVRTVLLVIKPRDPYV